MQIRVFQPVTIFAQRISYQSTCVRVRTNKHLSTVCNLGKETKRDYYSEEFSIEGTKSESAVPTGSFTVNSCSEQRMPLVAAVVAHRRLYPPGGKSVSGASSGGSAPGSKRSSCAVKVSALSILAPPLAAAGLAGVCRSTSTKFSGGSYSCKKGGSGGCHPIFDLRQLGALLKGPTSAVLAESRRYYAKGKDKPKSKKSQVVISETEMAEVINVASFRGQLEKLLEEMKEEYTKQLNVRGAAGALELLEVDFDGQAYPLQELAQVGRKNPQLAVLNLASLPDAIQPVMKAISESGMNLNPQQEGTTIYVPLPKVTREHRESLAKNAKVLFTKYKTSMQAVQNKYLKQCKSQKELSEDLVFNVQQQIMKFTENYAFEAEKLMNLKQKELLENK